MNIRITLATLTLIVAGLQIVNAQKVVVKLKNNNTLEYDLSQVDCIMFEEAEEQQGNEDPVVRFSDLDTTVYVNNLELGDYTTSITYKARNARKKGFVTVMDSVLVYSVNYQEFSFSYELEYEVTIYDDGITRQVMPYHPIVNIRGGSNGSYQLPTDDDGKFVYARKNLQYTIWFTCNGKEYQANANVKIRKKLDRVNGPYVVKSRVLDEALECGSRIMSSIYVERTWSNGVTEKEAVTLPLNCEFSDHEADRTPHDVGGADIRILSSYLEDVEVRSGRSSYKFINYKRIHMNWVVKYNYNLTLEIPLYYDEAWYDDGYTVHKLPCYTYSHITNREPQITLTESNDSYEQFKLYQWVDCEIGNLQRSGGSLLIFRVRK